MAYQEKYYFTFEPTLVSETHRVELWHDTGDVLIAEEVTAGLPPFVVEMPEIDNKFQVVRGTGCGISLLSDTDFKFFDGLYHVDDKEFMVLHYIDGTLEWCGYLNSEFYSEPYDQSENYIISVTGNDGFNLMDRLFFNESDASNYVGLKSEWELLQIVLDKIGLPYTDIRISLSTTFTGYSGGATKTILHETYVDSSNFYDEDNKPMTLREVVESILTPYGAFIQQSDASIYITDIHTLAGGGSITYKQYDASTYAYIADVVEVNEKSVSSIGYLGTGQQIEISGGTNRQLVIYSAYADKEVTGELLVTPEEFTIVPPSFSTKDGYFYRTLDNHVFYNTNNAADFEESAESLSLEHFVYYRHPVQTVDEIFLRVKSDDIRPSVTIEPAKLANVTTIFGNIRRYLDGASFLITGKALAKTKANPYAETYSQAELDAKADKVTWYAFRYAFTVDDGSNTKYYDRITNSFIDSVANNNYIQIGDNSEIISNKWVDFSHKMDVSYADEDVLINGLIDFYIFAKTRVATTGGTAQENSDPLQEIWIRNLNISLVNRDGSEVQDVDFEYIGELDKTFSKEGDTVNLTTGTSSLFSDKGKKCYFDSPNYKSIQEWTRAAQTYSVEELLLGSLSSNFRAGYISLLNMNLKNSFSPMNVLTDTYTGDRIMMQKMFSKDYYNNVINTDIEEISEDELTIVIE